MANGFLNFYQYLPEHINPIAFTAGSFTIKWYSLMYLVAFLVVYFLLKWRMSKGEFPNNAQITSFQASNLIFDSLIYLFVGLLIGARLGYVAFYDLGYFLQNPLEIFLPIRLADYGLQFAGISGMSYFGGLLGVVSAGYIFARRRKIDFWQTANFIVPAIPAGYFFGRLGNFLNGELYGRITDKSWGMYFPADPFSALRHPSQLYEAFFEGLVLFAILWGLRNGIKYKNKIFSTPCLLVYMLGYGTFRFFLEFFREPDRPDSLFFGLLTLSQVFSLILAAISLASFFLIKKSKSVV